ncbi:MAG: trypsin-like peptidase domain-containing protein [Verrucomicrobium sp.]|nr:trypsin-like peptidase domain-containing protein [Verrucomicrobium sp.]
MKLRIAAVLATLFFLPQAHALTPADEPLVKVVEKTRPAVVNIYSERVVQRQVADPFDQFFGRYYNVRQKLSTLGSGVLISPDGYIVTCAHIVGRADDKGKIKVVLTDGTSLPAQLLDADEDADLALLKVDAKKPLPYLSLAPADLSPNLLGETVVAIGDPIGYQSSVSSGILSAKERRVETSDGPIEGLLQTDAAINPGNSGGALVDIEGKFVGLSNAKTTGAGIESIGFAIPGAKVGAWAADAIAIAKGEKPAPKPVPLTDIVRDRFGLGLQAVTPELAEAFGLPSTSGLLVSDVVKGSPAAAVGIPTGVLLVQVGTVPIVDTDSLPRQLRGVKPGDSVSFTIATVKRQGAFVLRNSQAVTLKAR